jgi:uncharacterized protein with von Willebrand factor type A (vWA) domain
MARFQLPFQERIQLRERLSRKLHSTVVHDPTSDYHLDRMVEKSGRFEKTVQEKPEISPDGEPTREYEPMPELTKDVFHAHYQVGTDVEVRPPGEVMPTSALHAEIMGHYVVQDDFTKTRARTQGDDLMAAVATMAAHKRMIEEVARVVEDQPDPSQDQQQQQDAQQRIDDLRAQAQANGGALDAAAKQALKDAIQQRNAAEAAIAATPAPTGGAAVAQAMAADAKDAADTMSGMPGMGSHEVDRPSLDEAMELVEQVRSQPNLRLMLDLMGRLERDFRFSRARRVIEGRGEVVGVTVGNDPEHILPDEFGLLTTPETTLEFYRRYIDRSLLQFEVRGEERAGKGPLVVLRDSSGSMGKQVGELKRFEWAAALSLALMRVANREKRASMLVDFTSRTRVRAEVPANGRLDVRTMLPLAGQVMSGGTDCDGALRLALERIRAAGRFDAADVVLITDGEDHFASEAEAVCRDLAALGVRIHGVAITNGSEPHYLAQAAEITDGTACSVTDFSGAEQVRQIATAMA